MEAHDVLQSYSQLDEPFHALLAALREALGGEYRIVVKVEDYRRIQAVHVAHPTRDLAVRLPLKQGLRIFRTSVSSTDIARIRKYFCGFA
jgi:hypothetical protein